ncbi:hypothetical protein DRQ15_05095 [candidate division KSB1 bacterium]|nr:MAG: hypothetical protein DRQ15_05095 [candidate division KSB1 bacterium]
MKKQLLILLIILSPKVFALSDSDIAVVYRYSYGEAQCVFVKGNYSYVGTSVALLIFDISDSSKIELVGHLYNLGGFWDLTAEDSLVYGVGGEGLRIIDVSNPANPIEVGSFGDEFTFINIFLSGYYAYIVEWGRGFKIVDVSNPKDPREIGSYAKMIYPWAVQVSKQYAFVTTMGQGLCIFDVSDPTNPELLTQVNPTTSSYALSVLDSCVYVSIREGGGKSRIEAIDISDIANPRVVGFWKGFCYSMYGFGNLLYLPSGASLRILDVSDPANPEEIGHYEGVGYNDVHVVGHYAYVSYRTRRWTGLTILDVSDPPNPQELGSYAARLFCYQSVVVSGNYAYLACGDAGLQIMDITTPETPEVVGLWNGQRPEGGYDTGFILGCLALYDHYAYVADWGSGIYILDISDPTDPQKAGYYRLGYGVDNAIVSGHYLYVTLVFEGLRILDISDPIAPQEVGSYKLEADGWKQVRGLDVSSVPGQSNYAYLLAQIDVQECLLILDVSNPMDPKKVGEYIGNAVMLAIDVEGEYAYIVKSAVDQFRLLTVDLSEKASPRVIADLLVRESILPSGTVRISGSYAYLYETWRGPFTFHRAQIVIIDVSDPSHPSGVAACKIDDREGELYASNYLFVSPDNYIYVALGVNGFNILKFAPTDVEQPLPTPIVPNSFNLSQNHPNPFNAGTIINYQLSNTARVKLTIYNLLGQQVRTLVDEVEKPGYYTAYWNGRDDQGLELPSGVYFYRLRIDRDKYVETTKLLLFR